MKTLILGAALSAFFISGIAHAAVYMKYDGVDGSSAQTGTQATLTTTQTSTTSASTRADVTTEPEEASGDVFLKIEGIEGESEEKKKGNVEYNWKVEEGESAASTEVEREMKESGEKGGTEDINIGVGELQEGRVNKVDAINIKQSTVSVSAVEVRGWDPEKKQEFLATVKAHAEIQSEQDLENFAKGVLVENEAVEEISLNFEKIKVKHRASGKLFGFIPLTFSQEVEVDTEGDDVGRVKVKMPWYSFLVKADVAASEIEGEAQAAAEDKHKQWIDVESFSFSARAEALLMVSNILKAKLGTSAAADDAASSLQGSMGF